jgi:hypothetical protein
MTIYDPAFFARNRSNSVRSAEVILPYLFEEIYRPTSICDVGCGAGGFLAVAKTLGVTDILGIDGPYVAPQDRLIGEFLPVDLATDVPNLERMFDLAICLEVRGRALSRWHLSIAGCRVGIYQHGSSQSDDR